MKTQLTSTIAVLAFAVSANAAFVLPTLGNSITVEAEAFDSQVGTAIANDATFASGGQFVDGFQSTGTDYIEFDITAAPDPSLQYEITLYYRCGLTPPSQSVISESATVSQTVATADLTTTGWGGNPFATITSDPFTFSATATALRFSGIDSVGGQASHLKGAYHLDRFTLSAVSVVPEPSSIALLGLGGLALFLRRRS